MGRRLPLLMLQVSGGSSEDGVVLVLILVAGSYPSSFGDAPRVIAVDFPMLSLGSDRAQQLSDNGVCRCESAIFRAGTDF